jgi:hypothetical protein
MDLLWFFKEKMHFLELKFVNPYKTAQPHRIPRPGSDAVSPPAARVWLARHWWPQAIPRETVRPGAVWAGVWPS